MDEDYEDGPDGGDCEISFDSLVNNAVIYIASVDENHFPIKRADIIKNALPPKNGKKFHDVMVQAKKLLEQTFGLILLGLDDGEKVFITVSKFTRPQSINLFQFSLEHRRKRTLLLIVLSYVFMMDNLVSEDNLWKYLAQLKLVDRTESYVHPHFGNVRRICTTDFVRHMYLKIEKVVGTNPPENAFIWGPRSNIEFNKLEVLKFVSLMQSNIAPEKFTAQWVKLNPEEKEAASINQVPPKEARQPFQVSNQKRRRK